MSQKTVGNLFVIGQFALLAVLLILPQGSAWPSGEPVATMGYALNLVGMAIVIFAIASLGKSLTANPVPLEEATLKTTGLYAVVRHPIYFGFILAASGLTLKCGSWVSLAVFGGLVLLLNFKARFEERLLIAKYDGYLAYASKVGRLVPGLGRLRVDANKARN